MENKTSTSLKIATLTGALIASIALPLSMGANAVLDNGLFMVKAQDQKDSSIVAFAGIDPRGSDPDSGNPDSGDKDDPNSAIYTYSIREYKLVITQEMLDFSYANVKRLENNEALIPYPGGGWTIIVPAEELASGLTGHLLTTDGKALSSFSNLRNDAGFSLGIENSSGIQIANVQPGGAHLPSIPYLLFKDPEGTYQEQWQVNGKFHRIDGPALINYAPDGQSYSEIWYKDGKRHNEHGLSIWKADITGQVHLAEHSLNGVKVPTLDQWVNTYGMDPNDWKLNPDGSIP